MSASRPTALRTPPAIAAALNAAGVPLASGKPWGNDSVLMVLRNHAYIGRRGLPALLGGDKHGVLGEGGRLDLVEHQVKLLRASGAAVARVWLAVRGVERFE